MIDMIAVVLLELICQGRILTGGFAMVCLEIAEEKNECAN